MFKRKAIFLYLVLPLLLTLFGCKDDPARHLKLGNWYYQKGLLDEAILEYREVTRLIPAVTAELTREDYQILARAHYSLALVYSKKGWYDYALKEALSCFDLQPTRDNYELVQLIKKRSELEEPARSSD